ncbi:MFS transporter [Nisaea sediminum]|uniref:MFS transporter n=1 Tax=Nisaea sediminum TaxID=2775867 RepID=UPI001866F1E8|nr:MFS transporter [Nisaea sediminum]
MLKNLFLLLGADALVRSAYQMGKSPVLPVFAAALGADEVFLGIIVSVSVMTGMATKPVFGFLSDRWGRWIWMVVGVSIFSGVPVLYWFVTSPSELFAIRSLHGFATAIFGPVTLAYVGSMAPYRKANWFGWFSLGRGAGYVIGPVAGGFLLSVLSPQAIYTLVGFISLAAFIPLAMIDKGAKPERRPRFRLHVRRALSTVARSPAIWFLAAYETFYFVAFYALKAFLPVYALSAGMDIAMVGLFFGLQELVSLSFRPIAGIVGDRIGYMRAIMTGLALVSAALFLLSQTDAGAILFAAAVLIGIGSGLIQPATQALLSNQVGSDDQGSAFGVFGAIRNGGKVLGPVLGGVLISVYGFHGTLVLFSGMLTVVIALAAFAGVRKMAARKS